MASKKHEERLREKLMQDAVDLDDGSYDVEDLHIIGESTLGTTIQDVVVRLPADVAKWTIGNITFVDFTGLSGLACHLAIGFPSQHKSDKNFGDIRLLVIVAREKTDTDERAEFLIAHEIAHHWYGHFVGSAKNNDEYERQEQEADSQANAWGFHGTSTRIGSGVATWPTSWHPHCRFPLSILEVH